MCGICGKFSLKGVTQEDIRPMLEVLAHRGPDDEGIVVKDKIGLGNRRLSVIDLSGGHQPISNEDGSIWIVYNGEIYNHRLLREMLEEKGHIFRTNSDTEVIVHLYEEFGERCVGKLRGMFAFAIWDENQQKLILARDHLGQKPLFYSQIGHDFWFASEIKSILAGNSQKREMDLESLHHYLSLRFIPSPRTMLQGIQKLPAGHFLVLFDGKIERHRYWALSFRQNSNLSESDIIDAIRERLVQTVKSHLISDVPIGAFLSGGLDSSMIVALMANEIEEPFKTFSIGVNEQDFDELPYARIVAEHYRTEHFEHRVNLDLMASIPQMIWYLDEPSDPIAACQFQAASLAAQHVKVVLGGDGGDELFGGFDRYRGVGYVGNYARIPNFARQHLIGPLINWLPENFTYKSKTQQLRWMHQLSFLPGLAERYSGATLFFRFDHKGKQDLFAPHLWDRVREIDSGLVITNEYNRSDAEDPFGKMLYADYMTRLTEHSLMLTDRMTMAHGLELRSPFLDHELVEFMAAVPSNLKINGRNLKSVLRKIAIDYLPEPIVKRSKQGFMFPVAYWFQNSLSEFLSSFLSNSHFVQTGIFEKEQVLQLINEHCQNKFDHHVRLWMLLNLEIWHQLVIENRQVKDVTENIQEHLYTKI
jgi:asparagine synthase (glutamine-hydrolysing)